MHEAFMRQTIALALDSVQRGAGGPFGALIVRNGRIVGQGTNLVTSTNDPTAHAEVVAIRNACRDLGTFHLEGCDIYASCEPCPMCLAAVYWARLDRVFFASTRGDAAGVGFDDEFFYQEFARPLTERRLSMTQLLRDEAQAALDAWKVALTKTPY